MYEIPGTTPSDDLMDTIIKFGLYLGAIFQLFCIAAVIVLPEGISDNSFGQGKRFSWSFCVSSTFPRNSRPKDGDLSDEDGSEGSPHATPRRPHAHHRTRKQEKKKRR